MNMRIIVDRSLCDGNGLCVAAAPGYFALDDDDELKLLREAVETSDMPDVEQAIRLCPKAALGLFAP